MIKTLGAGVLATVLLTCGCGGPAPTPSVTLDPIDVNQQVAQPCTLLTPELEKRRHLVPPGTVITQGTMSACRWSSSDPPRFPSVTAGANANKGLADLHPKDYTYFQNAGKIDGYPAVHTDTTPGGPASGHCTAQVGVGPHATVAVGAGYPGVTNLLSADPCAAADAMATEIVGALAASSP